MEEGVICMKNYSLTHILCWDGGGFDSYVIIYNIILYMNVKFNR